MEKSHMLNISCSFKNIFVKQNHVYYLLIIEYEGKIEPPAPPKPEPIDEGPERFSRLRRYIWSQLLALYNAYVDGRNLELNDK